MIEDPAAILYTEAGNPLAVDASDRLKVAADALPLPDGASTEATLEAARLLLVSIAAEDFATETTLATRATEATLEAARLLLASIAAEDFATEATLSTRSSSANQTNGNQIAQAVGDVAHDTADTGAPVKIGGTATAARATAVGEGDRVQASLDLQGQVRVAPQVAATSATSGPAAATSTVTVLALNAARLGATVYNDATKAMKLKLGGSASTTDFTVQISKDGYYEVPFSYTGIITAVWATGVSGNARVTEITA